MAEDQYKDIDEALLPFHQHINDMLSLEGEIATDDNEIRMRIYEMNFESPVQLDIIAGEEGVVIGSSPPLYYVETGMLPVFHTIKVRAVAVENDKYIKP